MGITLGHKYRWHATTEKKFIKYVQKIIVRFFANYDEIMMK